MPTLLAVKNLLYIIHTRDHGHPHVTVYLGTPENFEAMAKIRLDNLEPLEVQRFNEKTVKALIEEVGKHQTEWIEVWNEIFRSQK